VKHDHFDHFLAPTSIHFRNIRRGGYNMSGLALWYMASVDVCLKWAPHASTVDLKEIVNQLPTPPSPPPLNIDDLAIAACEKTGIADEGKLLDFRNGVNSFLTTPGVPAVTDPFHLLGASAEPWHSKDTFIFLAELMLQSDLSQAQPHVAAIFMQAVISYGRDASALIAFLGILTIFPRTPPQPC
jgi:hypothetical protein